MGNKGVERAFENDGGRQIKGRKEKKRCTHHIKYGLWPLLYVSLGFWGRTIE